MKPQPIRTMIIGIPNVGKSSLINRLAKRKAAGVQNKPGYTRGEQWINVNKDFLLLDTPGILWPKLENQHQAQILASLSSIKEEILDPQALAIFIIKILSNLYPNSIKERYKLDTFDLDDIVSTFDKIALRRGALKKGGIVDYDKVSDIIVRDFKNGYFGKITFDRL